MSAATPVATPREEEADRIYYEGENASQLSPALCQLLKSMDPDGKGWVAAKTVEGVATGADRASKVRMSNAPTGHRSRGMTSGVLRSMDFDGDGFIGSKDLEMAVREKTMMRDQHHMFGRVILALVICLAVICAAMFGVSFAAVELAKDTHVGSDSVVRTDDGDIALIGSTDIMVFNGTLLQRRVDCDKDGVSCRRLTSETEHAVATRPAEERRTLSSRIADEIFQKLDKVTVQFAEADGINTEVTLRVHGFMRTRSAGSHCGTIVRLDMLEGTIILDDADLHFDARMLAHFSASGMEVAHEGEMSAYGRRLQSNLATVLGFFSYFEDIEFRCQPENVTRPRGPQLPYTATFLQKKPCLHAGMCQSTLFPGMYLPGYDAESDSMWSVVTVLIAETYSIMVQTLPNHPTQELRTVTDKLEETTNMYQVVSGEVSRCRNTTYAPVEIMGVDRFHIVYLGEATREGATYDLFGEHYTINGSTNRVFRLRPNEAAVDASPVEYEDDPVTFMPKRLYVHGARAEGWDVEEILTLEVAEIDEATADQLKEEYTAGLECNRSVEADEPLMKGPLDEDISQVAFYVGELKDIPADDEGHEHWSKSYEYWSYALQTVDEQFIADHTAKEVYYANATRRLYDFDCNDPTPAGEGFFAKFSQGNCLYFGIDHSNGFCITGGAKTTAVSPSGFGWYLKGGLQLGQCHSSYFSASGKVEVGFGWQFPASGVKYVWGMKFGAEVWVYGWIQARMTQFQYQCRRRLDEAEDQGLLEDDESNAAEDSFELDHEAVDDAADGMEDLEAMQHSNATGLALSDAEADSRRLWWSRRRRRRYVPRRRRVCTTTGVLADAGIGVKGGVHLGFLGASISGSLTVEVGPWPQGPLDARLKGYLGASACVNFLWWSICFGIGTFDLFDMNI